MKFKQLLPVAQNAACNLPIIEPVQFRVGASLPVEPYLLGLLLGDGCLRGKVELTTADVALLDAAEQLVGPDVKCTRWRDHRKSGLYAVGFSKAGARSPRLSSLAAALKGLGLYDLLSTQKFIPEIYLRASVTERLELLRGLMDTDGGAERTAAVFYSSSKRLVDDVAELVQLLGGTAYISDKIPYYANRGTRIPGKRAYRVSIRLPYGVNPFRLSRKAIRWNSRPHNDPVRQIVSVEGSRIAPARCILVAASDNLYVTEAGIVTHNTSLVRAIARALQLPLYVLDLTGKDFNDRNLIVTLAKVPVRAIVLIEDLDAQLPKERQEGGSLVTLSGLLNALDGPLASEGRILFVTSNVPENLDAALLGEGRIDVRVDFGYATREQIAGMYLQFFPGRATDAERFADAVPAGVLSPASIQEHLVARCEEPERVMTEAHLLTRREVRAVSRPAAA